MITDVPTSEDFHHSGIAFLNLAWDNAMTLKLAIEGGEDKGIDNDILDEYWNAAQKPLSTALALTQQGIEMLLKAKIAEVSPYLLISGPRDWPSRCQARDTAFSEYRTIDAQDLPKAYDAVAEPRLSEEFKSRFEELRRQRNTIFHTVDGSLTVEADDVLVATLEASEFLIGQRMWFDLRRTHLESDHNAALYSTDHIDFSLSIEILSIVNMLPPAEVLRFVGMDKRQRRYLCPSCLHEALDYERYDIDLAQLVPNTPDSTNLYCHGCHGSFSIVRQDCPYPECEGNVLEREDYEVCLTCAQDTSGMPERE